MQRKHSHWAFSSNAFKQVDLVTAVHQIAEAGFDAMEVMADKPHAQPDRWTINQHAQLKRAMRETAMAASNVNAFTGYGFPQGDTYNPTWIDDDPNVRQQRIDFTLGAIELAGDLQSPTVSLQPGGPAYRLDRDTCEKRFADGLAACLETAEACDVILAVEPEPGLLLETSTEFVAFKKRYFPDEPRVMMNADMGHFFCVREDPAAVIAQCAAWISHVHIEDISADRVHQHLPLGEGAMDFEAIFQSLDQIGYTGYITVELYPYTHSAQQVAQQARHFLQPWIQSDE